MKRNKQILILRRTVFAYNNFASHGPMEAVYVNGAPQGINYHDEENYTVYVSPYMTVTAERYTKHYYSNSQRIAAKLGTGEFDNVYGVNNFHLTAGQKDYAERMVQIEESRQEYMMENGIPPGVPTQKGQNIEPEITGAALPNKPLGNYDVPDGWPTPPHFNAPGDVPGPPLQWEEPEDLSNVEAGYGFVSDNEEENDIFFFHSDHLGSTSYLTDKDGNACEYVFYTPYGEALVNENNTDFENLYKFSGMELDKVTKLYNHGARQRDFWSTIWLGPDPLSEQFPMFSPYTFCNGNPVGFVDLDGNQVIGVHGTWSDNRTWKRKACILDATNRAFGDNKHSNFDFNWSGGNYASSRTIAAKDLVKMIQQQRQNEGISKDEPITLVGHSHGGNVIIEAINMMVEMEEFNDIQINLLTINTPVRDDYQLSEKAKARVCHVNVYDPQDPVQINGGHSMSVLPDLPRTPDFMDVNTKGTGEYGKSGRIFNNANNIKVNNPQNWLHDFHNSHNRVYDWYFKLPIYEKE